jgi:hypothetical protein
MVVSLLGWSLSVSGFNAGFTGSSPVFGQVLSAISMRQQRDTGKWPSPRKVWKPFINK